jgi:hypothetical protein
MKRLCFGLVLASVGALMAPRAHAQKDPPPKVAVEAGVSVQGKILRLDAPDRFVVQTSAGKEVILYTRKDTRYLINDKAARYSDLRVGADIRTAYIVDGDRYFVDTVTVGAPVAPADGTVLEGTVVKVVGEDQIIVRNTAGKEIVVYVNPKTTYNFDDRPAKFVDVRPGVELRINYDERDRRFWARSVLGVRRAKK